MTLDGFQWSNYYKNISGREPRELVVDVVARFAQEQLSTPRTAIDLGCGDGTETAFLLANGWHVLAINGEPTAFEHLHPKIPPEAQERLQTQVAKFETVELAPVDLIYAGFSIPFCHPQHFDVLWQKIVDNINAGGRFAGQLFGVNDTWASNTDMTFFTAEQAQALLADFDVEYFREEDADGQSSVGAKHWHVFHIIAQKK